MVHTDTRIHTHVRTHTLKLFSKVAASVLFTLCTEVRHSIACGREEGESRSELEGGREGGRVGEGGRDIQTEGQCRYNIPLSATFCPCVHAHSGVLAPAPRNSLEDDVRSSHTSHQHTLSMWMLAALA